MGVSVLLPILISVRLSHGRHLRLAFRRQPAGLATLAVPLASTPAAPPAPPAAAGLLILLLRTARWRGDIATLIRRSCRSTAIGWLAASLLTHSLHGKR